MIRQQMPTTRHFISLTRYCVFPINLFLAHLLNISHIWTRVYKCQQIILSLCTMVINLLIKNLTMSLPKSFIKNNLSPRVQSLPFVCIQYIFSYKNSFTIKFIKGIFSFYSPILQYVTMIPFIMYCKFFCSRKNSSTILTFVIGWLTHRF